MTWEPGNFADFSNFKIKLVRNFNLIRPFILHSHPNEFIGDSFGIDKDDRFFKRELSQNTILLNLDLKRNQLGMQPIF